MKRDKEIRFRLTRDEKETLVEAARHYRTTQSAFVRHAISSCIEQLDLPKKILKIKKNAIFCLNCGSVIESKYRHDFKMCKCDQVGVDGGKDYLRRIGENYEERSEYE